VNQQDYKVGALSIEVFCPASPYMDNLFENRLLFNPGRELNLTNGKLFELWMKATKLGGSGGLKSSIHVKLCSNGYPGSFDVKCASKYVILTGEDWEHFSLNIGETAAYEWIIEPGFDWTKITAITFAFEQYSCGLFESQIAYLRLDGLLFHYGLDVSIIAIDSNPFNGVPVRLDSTEGKTPVVWQIEPPAAYDVTIASEFQGWLFDHWDDGILTPGRRIDASIPGTYAHVAFYRSPTEPPPKRWQPGYYLQLLAKTIKELLTSRKLKYS
jgi:hypothetical protein